MTRQRNDRGDWATMASVEKRLQILAPKVMALGVESLTPNERLVWESNQVRRKPRAKPVQHEAHEMVHLSTLVMREWWAPGYQRWEHRSSNQRESEARWREGASPGWPDCGLFIPVAPLVEYHFAVRAVCEVKAENHRPKRDPGPNWWLEPFGNAASRHGVRREQAQWLQVLSGCGFDTFVAYSGAEAFSWLSERAGPRPDVLPGGWA